MSDYLAGIGRVPMLTPAEEIELGNQVQAGQQLLRKLAGVTPDADQARALRMAKRAKDRMVAANLRLVVSVSKRFGGRGVDQLDLCQEGTLGLIRAVEKFDPTRGYRFSTYSFWWIRQAMQRAIDAYSRTIRVPVHMAELHRKVRGLIQQRQHEGHGMPTIAELAEVFGETEPRIRDALTLEQPMASLSSRANRDEGSELGELLACPGPSPDDVLRESERLDALRDILDRAMAKMPPLQREALVRRFALAGGQPETLRAIGRDLGLSCERIRQYESKALAIIKSSSVGVTELLRE
jgi:RNA polymerase primary sigma factor